MQSHNDFVFRNNVETERWEGGLHLTCRSAELCPGGFGQVPLLCAVEELMQSGLQYSAHCLHRCFKVLLARREAKRRRIARDLQQRRTAPPPPALPLDAEQEFSAEVTQRCCRVLLAKAEVARRRTLKKKKLPAAQPSIPYDEITAARCVQRCSRVFIARAELARRRIAKQKANKKTKRRPAEHPQPSTSEHPHAASEDRAIACLQRCCRVLLARAEVARRRLAKGRTTRRIPASHATHIQQMYDMPHPPEKGVIMGRPVLRRKTHSLQVGDATLRPRPSPRQTKMEDPIADPAGLMSGLLLAKSEIGRRREVLQQTATAKQVRGLGAKLLQSEEDASRQTIALEWAEHSTVLLQQAYNGGQHTTSPSQALLCMQGSPSAAIRRSQPNSLSSVSQQVNTYEELRGQIECNAEPLLPALAAECEARCTLFDREVEVRRRLLQRLSVALGRCGKSAWGATEAEAYRQGITASPSLGALLMYEAHQRCALEACEENAFSRVARRMRLMGTVSRRNRK